MSVKKRAKELGYCVELLTPITMRWPPPENDPDQMALKQEIRGKLDEKVELLLKHYNLDGAPDSGRQLALRLARDWVPGFKFTKEHPRARGRKVSVTPEAQVDLFNRIEAIRVSQALKLGEACREFLRQNRSDPLWAGKTARYVEIQYRKGELLSKLWEAKLDEIFKGTSFAGYGRAFTSTGLLSNRRRKSKRSKPS